MTYQKLPTVEELNDLFIEKEPGVLYYRGRGSTRVPIGARAGNIYGPGYCTIIIRGYKYLRHRLIWKLHKGSDPLGMVHHIDETPGNDWIENLADVTASENTRGNRNIVDLVLNNAQAGLTYAVRFHLDLWADEDGSLIQKELSAVVEPIVARIIANRLGRKRVR